MNAFAALGSLRIGCVRYLNSRPLIFSYPGEVTFEHPSILADQLAQGTLDAALVPVFEVLRHPEYHLVDDVAIACDGPVFSVFLAHRVPIKEITRIQLDPASLSSAHLLAVLLAEYHGLQPEWAHGTTECEPEAQLLIGNQAIDFRCSAASEGWQLLDLGAEWKRCTGLPFVFAVWAIRPELARPEDLAAALRKVKTMGMAALPQIIEKAQEYTLEIREQYLTSHIRFNLGSAEHEALRLYASLLAKYGWIPADPSAGLKWI